MAKPEAGPFTEIRVKLPTFLVIALRTWVRETNDRGDEPPWTLSQLVETLLIESIDREEMERLAKRSPEIIRQGRAWHRWLVRSHRRGGR